MSEQIVPEVRKPKSETVATPGTVAALVDYCRDIMPSDKGDAVLDSFRAMLNDKCEPFYMLKQVTGMLATWLEYGN